MEFKQAPYSAVASCSHPASAWHSVTDRLHSHSLSRSNPHHLRSHPHLAIALHRAVDNLHNLILPPATVTSPSIPHSSPTPSPSHPCSPGSPIEDRGKMQQQQQQEHSGQFQAQEFKAPEVPHSPRFHSTPLHKIVAPGFRPAQPLPANVGGAALGSEHDW